MIVEPRSCRNVVVSTTHQMQICEWMLEGFVSLGEPLVRLSYDSTDSLFSPGIRYTLRFFVPV